MTPPPVSYQPRWRVKPVVEWATLALAVGVPLAFGAVMLWSTDARLRDALDMALGGWMIALISVLLSHWVSVAGGLARIADAGFRHDLWLTGRAPREVILGEVFKRARHAVYQIGAVLACLALGFQVGGSLGNVNANEMISIPLIFLGGTIVVAAFGVRLLTGMASVRAMNRALGLGILHVLMAPVLFYLLLVPLVAYMMAYGFSFDDADMERRLTKATGLPVAAVNQELIVGTLVALVGIGIAAAGFVPRIERNLRQIESWFGVFEGRPEPVWAPVLSGSDRWPVGKLVVLMIAWVVLAWLHVSLFFEEIIGLKSEELGLLMMALLSAGALVVTACGVLGILLDQLARRRPGVSGGGIALRATPWALALGLPTLAIALMPAVGALVPLFGAAPGTQSMEKLALGLLIHGGLLLTVPLLALVWLARVLFLSARRLGTAGPSSGALMGFAMACSELFWLVLAVPIIWLVPNAIANVLLAADPMREGMEQFLGLRSHEGPVLALLVTGALGLLGGLAVVMLAAWRWASVHARWRDAVAPREPLASDPPATAPSVP